MGEPETVTRQFVRTMRARSADPALARRHDDGWHSLSWGEYGDRAARTATALRTLGVERGDRVVLMMRNRPEFNVCDTGTLLAGATPFSIYSSSSPEQVQYLAAHSEAVVAIVEDAGYLERLLKVRADLPMLKQIVVVEDPQGVGNGDVLRVDDLMASEPIDVDRAAAESQPDDLLTLVYTSGTTGPPKGAMILHRNICWTFHAFGAPFGDAEGTRTGNYLSYLA